MEIDIIQVLNILDHKADIHRDPGMIREGLTDRLKDARIPLTFVDSAIGSENQPDPVRRLVPGPDEGVIASGHSLGRRMSIDCLRDLPRDRSQGCLDSHASTPSRGSSRTSLYFLRSLGSS